MSSIKCHTRYRLKNGTVVPSVTTLIDSCLGFNKRVLIAWARRKALEGLDPDAILKETGDEGTCSHLLIAAYLEGGTANVGDFSANQVKAGGWALQSFKSWHASNPFEVVKLEYPVVSESLKYGGCIDIIGKVDGKLALVDIKTSKGIWPEMIVQIAAYGAAYESQEGEKIENYHLLQLSKSGISFQHFKISPEKIETAFAVFKHCRELYDLQKIMKGFI